MWTLPCCGWARTSCCAAWAAAPSSAPTRSGASTVATAWTTAFSASWEDPDALPTLAFGNYLKPETVDDGSYVCDDDQLVRPDASGRQYAPPDGPVAQLLHAVDAVQRLGSLRPARPARIERPRLLPSARRGAAVAHDAGRRPRLYTRADGWQPVHIWGMGIASYDLTGDGYPEVFLTSQSDNRLQTLADGPAQPHYRDIAIERGRHGPRAVHRRRRSALDRLARRVRRREQRRPDRPVRGQGQR